MKKIITLAQSLMQEIERYDKELIEIEKVSDYRFEENEKLKKENKLLQQQIENMKNCYKLISQRYRRKLCFTNRSHHYGVHHIYPCGNKTLQSYGYGNFSHIGIKFLI